ncbi:MAG: DUF1080 domain-containing protein [bacterium]|nr:DUF1080 domain-containing protein [bacterium]
MKTCLTCVLAILLSCHTNTPSALAQSDAEPRFAATEAPDNDPEFELLGEFVGPISVGDNQYQALGLQVRPIGDDGFEGLQYSGGLPGQDSYDGEQPIRLVGRRNGDFVVLSGGPYAIFVEAQNCVLIDRNGNRVGQLERIHRGSPTMGVQPPEGATVLFDGTNTDQFTTAQMTSDGLLMEGADVKPMFQDFDLHVEFRLPYMPTSFDQARGNSGCYLQSRYEVQILDSFAQLPVFNGCSSIYRFKSPDLNMCLPPLQWQTYDIRFTAARWASDGTKIRNARITVWQNGVKTQDDVELKNKTGAGKEEAPSLLPIRFQNHKDPVRFRNIWIVDRGLSFSDFPVYPEQDSSAAQPSAELTSVTLSSTTESNTSSAAPDKSRKENRAKQPKPKKKKAKKQPQAEQPVSTNVTVHRE